ncbi:hypothetical protein H5410_011610 [Solanum commersonii]|uniref:Uncharacterized protein n=1 Tax=Solanum commersonii TaxID=4109 RepID=A0A9J6AP19_SOLCO|nr:hypothetical protein H5410_011610 [Solanum commersonii]
MAMLDVEALEKDNKILRAAMLKKRYANVMMKSQKQLEEEKIKSREAARIAIASVKRTVNFGNGLQAERDLMFIIVAPNRL